jgi:hypothetical protein
MPKRWHDAEVADLYANRHGRDWEVSELALALVGLVDVSDALRQRPSA